MQHQARTLPLKEIDIGELDANAEYFIAKKLKIRPIFIRAYYDTNFHGAHEFQEGTKFILFGQKGTGKTAILRSMESLAAHVYSTQFIVFRKEILEEAELSKVAIGDAQSIIVDEDKIKETRFYYHSMKRLFLSLLLARCKDFDDPPKEYGWISGLTAKIRSSTVGEIATYVADTITTILISANINVEKLSSGKISLDAAKLVKRSNDAFTKYCISQIKKSSLQCRLYFDEMHFAYMDESTLSADAALVRDTVLALQELNEKFIEENIDCVIYMSIRSEFLQHQEIATGDVMQVIQSYGREISWENYDNNFNHPIFDLMVARLRLTLGDSFTKKLCFRDFSTACLLTNFLSTPGENRETLCDFLRSQRISLAIELASTRVLSILF